MCGAARISSTASSRLRYRLKLCNWLLSLLSVVMLLSPTGSQAVPITPHHSCFPMEKQKMKDLEIQYGGKENRITLRFR